MTHSDLIKHAVKWLKRPYKNALPIGHSSCSVILTELVSMAGEVPDVIGFNSHKSVLIEAKTSISDFYADKQKYWRKRDEYGMGNLRYFICEPGIISVEKLPDKWGLINVDKGKITVIKDALYFDEKHWKNEIVMLLSHIRRNKKFSINEN